MKQEAIRRLVEDLVEVIVKHLGDQAVGPWLAVPHKKWLNNAEAAGELGITPESLAAWRYRGKGPKFYRPGVRYKPADIEAWLDANAVDPAA